MTSIFGGFFRLGQIVSSIPPISSMYGFSFSSGGGFKIRQRVSTAISSSVSAIGSFFEYVESFIPSPGASLLRDLASVDSDIPPQDFYNRDAVQKARYDCRHYLRLFRRLLTSDVLLNVDNICNEYFALHALLLRPGESFSPESSFLYNLFDNEDPELAGNALVRYRVLEYFHNNSEFGPIFNAYFRALGPGSRVARDIASSFVRAGLLTPKVLIDNEREIWTGINVTNAGRRHFAVARNLWYGICIKTGMLVEPDMIRRGDDARLLASKFVTSNKVLDFYAEHGWVSEEEFIGYLYRQEALEALRIGEFQASNKEFKQVITSLLEYKRSPADILSYDYSWQLYNWEKKRGTQ